MTWARTGRTGGPPRRPPRRSGHLRDDYSLGRDGALAHLGALDLVYSGVIEAHRKAIATTEDLDPVTQDMLIAQAGQLEQFQWFVRAHLEDPSGSLATTGARTEQQAAARGRKK